MNLVDLRVLWQNLVSQLLCRRQHLCVMHRDQVLNELLQLISVHLEESLWDGQAQFDLLRLPYSVQRERHDVGAVEDVLVGTAACYCCDFAAVEADAHVADQLRLWWCGWFPYCAAEVKSCKKERKCLQIFIWPTITDFYTLLMSKITCCSVFVPMSFWGKYLSL